MNILNALKQLRDDIKIWVTNNFNALNAKIDEKTISIDNELDSESTNPVQNKAIATEIADINSRVGDTPVVTQISEAIAKQPQFSGNYNDLTNAPDIYEDGFGNMVIVDESDNIIFSVDAEGAHTTNLTLDGKKTATEEYVDTAIQNAQLADKDINLTNYYTKQETEALIPDTSSFLKEVPTEYVTESELTDKGYLTEHQSLAGLATTSELEAHTSDSNIHVTNVEKQQWNAKSNFSGDYNDLTNAPDITEDGSGDLVIADANGNILFRSNTTGLETVNLTVESITINGISIQDMIRSCVEEVLATGNYNSVLG